MTIWFVESNISPERKFFKSLLDARQFIKETYSEGEYELSEVEVI